MTEKSAPSLDSDEKKVSYGFGLQFGHQLLQNQFEDMDLEAVFAGVRCSFNGQKPAATNDELDAAYSNVQAKIEALSAQKSSKAKELGQQFLDENAKREGIQVTESGIQYEILVKGSGSKPGASDRVKTHYHGTFIDGRVFDSSVERNEPAEFAVNQVIPGWTEILQLMPAGSKWRVAIPSDLAYGDTGSPPVIPGGSTLVFDIELLAVL
jgi:FKBP-type peptidyl-prolyl cis-trans isomerase FklB